MIHTPVLLNEVIEYLNFAAGANPAKSPNGDRGVKKIIDATLDGGSHANAILEKFPEVEILGIEFDPEILKEAELNPAIKVVNDSYVNLAAIVEKNNFPPDGIIFDLGLSLWHFERSGRGFSFKRDEILDMRFNPAVQKITAAEVVNTYNKEDLEKILADYGEEKFSREIVENIVRARGEKAIASTNELVDVIGKSVPEWYKHRKIHFATKTFQALRIAVNDELGSVEKGVRQAIEVLNPGGRLIVISFHGLEDKIVKNIFREKAKEGIISFVTKDTIKPLWKEVKINPRARSAKMKIIEKL